MENTGCMECGACSEACPIVELYPSRVVHEVYSRSGFDPWLCCSCHLCAWVCPVGLNPRNAMFALRRSMKESGAKGGKQVAVHMKNLKKKGFLFPVGDVSNDERLETGLEPIAYEKISSDMKRFVLRLDRLMETFGSEREGREA
ncbi:MAG TPA: 4Fe-4S dicluster domain-containing protein [Desulfobacteraceae bacterium]|nr:4Fe-4S dicluster domain-containing protein [Desulfobacteraceae bacterium]